MFLLFSPATLPNGSLMANEVKTYNRIIDSKGTLNEVPLTRKIYMQIEKDLYLRDPVKGYDPRWTFLEAPPSRALSDLLEKNNIIHVIYK